jgi:hypothetical protein
MNLVGVLLIQKERHFQMMSGMSMPTMKTFEIRS